MSARSSNAADLEKQLQVRLRHEIVRGRRKGFAKQSLVKIEVSKRREGTDGNNRRSLGSNHRRDGDAKKTEGDGYNAGIQEYRA